MYLPSKDRICSDLPDTIDLADTQLVSKYKIKIQSLLSAINVFKKYAGVALLKKNALQSQMLLEHFLISLDVNQTEYG